MASAPYDLVILGGGIVGAGVARDAAARGLRVVLVEKDDFASGTSSRSSKLIHGGLRYLEHGHLRLVRESTAERNLLLRLAPHLVRPMPFLLPVYDDARVGLTALDVGLWIYEGLDWFRGGRLHRTYRRKKALALEPVLTPEGLRGAVTYLDAATDDARLVLEVILAAVAFGAEVRSHTRAEALLEDASGRVSGVRVVAEDGTREELAARCVISTLGPWTDELLGGGETRIRRTKGIHIVVDRARLPVQHAVTLPTPDNRVIFAIPWDRRTYIGTTDTDYEGPSDDVAADAADVKYLLELSGRYFSAAGLTERDVLATWAGLRPLVAAAPDAPPGAVSREHRIWVAKPGLVVAVGGKLTTFRRMAEEIADVAADELGPGVKPSSTKGLPLPGAASLSVRGRRGLETTAAQLVADHGLDDDVAGHLVRTYGERSRGVLDVAKELVAPIDPELPFLWAEVDHAVRHELARTVADVFFRRVPLALHGRDQGLGAAPRAAAIAGGILGWDEARRKAEVAAFEAEVAKTRRWRT